MPFNPTILSQLLDARGLDADTLSSSLKISRDRFIEAQRGERVPTKNQIFKIADFLAVPAYAFFMESYTLKEPEIIDFRTKNPKPFKLGTNASKFEDVFLLRDFLAELYNRLDINAPENLLSEQPDENPEQFAATIAKLISIESLRAASKTKADFYKAFREKIEDLGVFVVQDHYMSNDIDGFAIYHGSFTSNLIYVNSAKRNQGAKTFTLAHELAHILGKRSAISGNYRSRNDIERFCNRFAASLLIPRGEFLAAVKDKKLSFKSYDEAVDAAKIISNIFKTSVSAALVRAVDFGLADGQYYTAFAKGFGSPDFADTMKPQGGGGSDEGPEPGIIDLAAYGKRAVTVMTEALSANKTTDYEIFKKTGLSRRRIEGLRTIAKKREFNLGIIA
jgi:Zn-dependent peptidase ImmA (M78 family)